MGCPPIPCTMGCDAYNAWMKKQGNSCRCPKNVKAQNCKTSAQIAAAIRDESDLPTGGSYRAFLTRMDGVVLTGPELDTFLNELGQTLDQLSEVSPESVEYNQSLAELYQQYNLPFLSAMAYYDAARFATGDQALELKLEGDEMLHKNDLDQVLIHTKPSWEGAFAEDIVNPEIAADWRSFSARKKGHILPALVADKLTTPGSPVARSTVTLLTKELSIRTDALQKLGKTSQAELLAGLANRLKEKVYTWSCRWSFKVRHLFFAGGHVKLSFRLTRVICLKNFYKNYQGFDRQSQLISI